MDVWTCGHVDVCRVLLTQWQVKAESGVEHSSSPTNAKIPRLCKRNQNVSKASGQGCFLKGLKKQGKEAGGTAALPRLAMEDRRDDLVAPSTWVCPVPEQRGILSTSLLLPSILVFLAQIFHAFGFTKTKASKGCVLTGAW